MGSIQGSVVNLFARSIRNSFFIHKASVTTQRNSFNRISTLAKYPLFVKKEQTTLGHIKAIKFTPKNINDKHVVLYLHGGAHCVGSPKSHKALVARIARASKCEAFAIKYRLAPENKFPASLEDACNAYLELKKLGYKRIFVAGDSSGGGLALSLVFKLRDKKVSLPAGLAVISPWTDLIATGESLETKFHRDPLINPSVLEYFAFQYVGDLDRKHPYISPLYGDMEGFPPVMIHVGSNEVLLDDSTRLAKKLDKAGSHVELYIAKNMFHVWHFLAGFVPEAKKDIKKIGHFFQSLSTPTKQIIAKKKRVRAVATV